MSVIKSSVALFSLTCVYPPVLKGKYMYTCEASGFVCEVDEKCILLGYYTPCSGSSLPTFCDNLSVLS